MCAVCSQRRWEKRRSMAHLRKRALAPKRTRREPMHGLHGRARQLPQAGLRRVSRGDPEKAQPQTRAQARNAGTAPAAAVPSPLRSLFGSPASPASLTRRLLQACSSSIHGSTSTARRMSGTSSARILPERRRACGEGGCGSVKCVLADQEVEILWLVATPGCCSPHPEGMLQGKM